MHCIYKQVLQALRHTVCAGVLHSAAVLPPPCLGATCKQLCSGMTLLILVMVFFWHDK